MKNLLIKVLSALCALAMLFALLPAAIAEEGGEAPQEIPAAEETVLPEEPAADEPAEESAPAEAPAPVEASAPAAEAAPADAAPAAEPASADEPAPAEAAPAAESVAAAEPVPAEESVAAGESAPAENAAPAEESAPAEKADSAEESVPADETVSAEEAGSDEEAAPADEAVSAEADDAEEIIVPVEESAEETAVSEEAETEDEAGEETGEEAADEEPVKLIIGNTLSDTVPAGREYKIELKATQTGSAMLTLILNRGQAMNVRIGDGEAEFTEVETGDPARIYFIHEMNVTEWCDYSVILTAGEDTPFTLKSECAVVAAAAEPAAEETEEETEDAAAEEPAGEEAEEEPDSDEQPAEESEENDEAPVMEESAQEDEPEQDQAAEEEMLNAGYIRVMIIRQNGTGLFAEQDEHAEAVGSLACGDIVWAKPAGNIWGEVYRGEESEPLYFNLNNAALQLGEVGYDVPVRKVELSSTLEGLSEIDEGSWVVINAEISGFTADEIAEITWQYRAAEDDEFCNIEDAHDFMYIYPVSSENVHYEWRIVLTIKS